MNWPILTQIQQFPTSTVNVLLGVCVALGLVGVLILAISTRLQVRIAGALLFPLLPAVMLFAIFPALSSSDLNFEYMGKVGGPVAAYVIIVFWAVRTVSRSDKDAKKLQLYDAHLKEQELRQPLSTGIGTNYSVNSSTDQRIIIAEGDIRQLLGDSPYIRPHVIVNSENDFLMLGRPYDRNFSGMLRYLDSRQDAGKLMEEDSLEISLRRRLGPQRLPVQIGAVFETRVVGLESTGVRFIFHVATVTTKPGGGYLADAKDLPLCVQSCFERFASLRAQGENIDSILFPLMGAGDGSLTSEVAAGCIVPEIVKQMQRFPDVQTVYMVAFRGIDRQAIVKAAIGENLSTVPSLAQ